MTKRNLIEALEALDCDDDTSLGIVLKERVSFICNREGELLLELFSLEELQCL